MVLNYCDVKLIHRMPGGAKIGADPQGSSLELDNVEDKSGHTCDDASPSSHTVEVITGK
jgi:hypothetical protein